MCLLCAGFVLYCVCAFADITKQPQSNAFPEYSDAYYSCDSDVGGAIFQWHIIYEGVDYDIGKADFDKDPWIYHSDGGFGTSSDGKSLYFEGIHSALNGATVYCIVLENGGSVSTQEALISVVAQGSPRAPGTDVPAAVQAFAGEDFSIKVGITPEEGASYSYLWYRTTTGLIQDIMAILDNETATTDELTVKPEEEGTYYYCAAVTAEKNGKQSLSYTSIITVNVEPAQVVETPTEEVSPDVTPTPEEKPTEAVTPTPEPKATETATGAPVETPNATETATQSEPGNTEKPAEETNDSNWFSTYTVIIIVIVVIVILVVIVLVMTYMSKSNDGGKGKKKKNTGKRKK